MDEREVQRHEKAPLTDRRERSLTRFSLARGEKDLVAVKILSPVNYGAMLQHMVGLLFLRLSIKMNKASSDGLCVFGFCLSKGTMKMMSFQEVRSHEDYLKELLNFPQSLDQRLDPPLSITCRPFQLCRLQIPRASFCPPHHSATPCGRLSLCVCLSAARAVSALCCRWLDQLNRR